LPGLASNHDPLNLPSEPLGQGLDWNILETWHYTVTKVKLETEKNHTHSKTTTINAQKLWECGRGCTVTDSLATQSSYKYFLDTMPSNRTLWCSRSRAGHGWQDILYSCSNSPEHLQKLGIAGHQWLPPVIPATQEAEI
jgi:hypothetical protein